MGIKVVIEEEGVLVDERHDHQSQQGTVYTISNRDGANAKKKYLL